MHLYAVRHHEWRQLRAYRVRSGGGGGGGGGVDGGGGAEQSTTQACLLEQRSEHQHVARGVFAATGDELLERARENLHAVTHAVLHRHSRDGARRKPIRLEHKHTSPGGGGGGRFGSKASLRDEHARRPVWRSGAHLFHSGDCRLHRGRRPRHVPHLEAPIGLKGDRAHVEPLEEARGVRPPREERIPILAHAEEAAAIRR
jgi:hypothetical protein